MLPADQAGKGKRSHQQCCPLSWVCIKPLVLQSGKFRCQPAQALTNLGRCCPPPWTVPTSISAPPGKATHCTTPKPAMEILAMQWHTHRGHLGSKHPAALGLKTSTIPKRSSDSCRDHSAAAKSSHTPNHPASVTFASPTHCAAAPAPVLQGIPQEHRRSSGAPLRPGPVRIAEVLWAVVESDTLACSAPHATECAPLSGRLEWQVAAAERYKPGCSCDPTQPETIPVSWCSNCAWWPRCHSRGKKTKCGAAVLPQAGKDAERGS